MPAAGGMGREPGGGGGLLHNMSAPPRLKITLNPIPAPPRAAGGPVAAPDVLPQGLRLVARVNLDPFRAAVDNGCLGSRRYVACDLARLILITRLAQGRPHRGLSALSRRSLEYLVDELQRGLLAIDVADLRMPAFAFVCRSAAAQDCDLPCETDPARALSLVARVSGRVFVARREPRAAALREAEGEYRFYAAAGKETP